MGNSIVSQKFSSLTPIPLVDTDKRWKFWNMYAGTTKGNEQRDVSVFEFEINENNVKELVKLNLSNLSEKEQEGGEEKSKQQNEKTTPNKKDKKQLPEQANVVIDCAKRALKFTKILRHPSIIKYVDHLEVSDTHFYLVTEPVVPLRSILHTLELSEILLGLYEIASALNFLNEQCQITFNNVHLDAIYVTTDKHMRWLLGDFQFAYEFNALDKDFYEKTKELRYSETITPEEGMKKFQKYNVTCRDVYAFEKLVSKIFNEIEEFKKNNNQSSNNNITYQAFLKLPAIKFWLTKALDSEPANRATFQGFLKLKIFEQDPLCNIMLFFDDMRAKNNAEKEIYFKELKSLVNRMTLTLFKRRILPRMLTLPFMTEPNSTCFLPHLFSPKDSTSTKRGVEGILEEKDYMEHIISFIRKCYQSRNYSLRIRILQTLEFYLPHIGFSIVQFEIVNEVLKGMKDSSNELVMFTMNALVLLSAYLIKNETNKNYGIETINNQFLPILHHYAVRNSKLPLDYFDGNEEAQKQSMVALRSHSLLCLLELWSIPGINKGIIYTALTNNLFDKEYYELKVHALNAILIHMSRFDPRELVTYILKPIMPLTLHQKVQVRAKASQVIKVGIESLDDFDLNVCSLGMVTSPNDGINNVTPIFPSTSKPEIMRQSVFVGQSPKHIISLPISGEKTSESVSTNNIQSNEYESNQRVESNSENLNSGGQKSPTLIVKSPVPNSPSTKLNSSSREVLQKQEIKETKETEEEEWNNWEEEENGKSVEVKVENTVYRPNIVKTPSNQNIGNGKTPPVVKKGVLSIETEEMDKTENTEQTEEDLFKNFGMEVKEPITTTVKVTSIPNQTSTKTKPQAKRGNKKPQTKRKSPSSIQTTPTMQTTSETNSPNETGMSKVLQETEQDLNNVSWDDDDMFSQMDIKQ